MPTEIRSPVPGTFYRKPAPDQPAFKEAGDSVAAGETVGLVEVMKTFIEIKAADAGVIAEFTVEDGTPVTPGQCVCVME
ncbi:acetyl-CoA carboxylase [Thioclava sp. FTW29]|uniref:Biotin carboxyl carrier protein of acetyl-CoA carboxylase n=1 Tax=Thioclava litoralis TaxID=3076557 RepID=A0ABZ1E4C5_9RHOB|nr:acetyl-CoA carboxylase [Thioclava sp. FTW29]